MRHYKLHELSKDVVDKDKIDVKEMLKYPLLANRIGEGHGDVRSGIHSKSNSSRGSGYPKQTVKALKNAPFQFFDTKDKPESLQILKIPEGPLLTLQSALSKHDKSIMTEMTKFIKNDLSLESTPDPMNNCLFEDVTGEHFAYLFLLKKGEEHTLYCCTNKRKIILTKKEEEDKELTRKAHMKRESGKKWSKEHDEYEKSKDEDSEKHHHGMKSN